jgi:hypothetical protein
MADAIQTKKLKNPYVDWRNRPYAANAGSEEKRKQGERWAALNSFIRKHGRHSRGLCWRARVFELLIPPFDPSLRSGHLPLSVVGI